MGVEPSQDAVFKEAETGVRYRVAEDVRDKDNDKGEAKAAHGGEDCGEEIRRTNEGTGSDAAGGSTNDRASGRCAW
ncbi:hypothetical protein [Roseicyclus amphidinii]|uniref:hypothetical protein n=1 Tax=Roseicyclus amphidinii TaxID=3034232 RepID=UPI0024E0A494|nr:hypothetical protein [Roseicyclus sp. Amp-Y-6]